MTAQYDNCRQHGVVAVVVRRERFLVIRRSEEVVAPGKICFPGGGIEAGESEEQTLVREIHEELGVAITPLRRVWRSVTPWKVELAWWLGGIGDGQRIEPNPAEVASVHWYRAEEMRGLPNLLESMHPFLDALESGAIVLDNQSP